MLLRDLPIGSLVKDSNSLFLGKPVIWRIADKNHEGYPDNSVTLITDKIVAIRAFDAKEPNNSDTDRQSYGNNRYSVSNIRQWINSDAGEGQWYSAQHDADQAPTAGNVYSDYNIYADDAGFLNGFSQNFKNALLDTTLIVGLNTVTDGGGSETVTDKIFLASKTEVGLTDENNVSEGVILSIFTDNVSRCTTVTQECLEDRDSTNGPHNTTDPYKWWLRTPYATKSGYSRYVNESGGIGGHHTYRGHYGVRPLCNVSSSVSVSSTTDEDGCYTLFDIPSIEGYLDSKGLAQVIKKTKEYVDNAVAKGALVYKGDYDNTVAYNAGDVVCYGSNLNTPYYFISLIDNNNNAITGPTVSNEYWANINYYAHFATMVKISTSESNINFPIPIMNGNYVYKPQKEVQATINAKTGLLKVMGLEINGSPAATEDYVDEMLKSAGGECNIPKYVGTAENPIDFGELYEKECMGEDGTPYIGYRSGKCFLEGYAKVDESMLSITQFRINLFQILANNDAGYVPENLTTLDEIIMSCAPVLVDYIYMNDGTDMAILIVFDICGAKVTTMATPYSGFLSVAPQVDLSKPALEVNVLSKNNTTEYTPTGNYHPTTKKYVDDKITYGTEDLTAGTSELATGTVYFVYE